MIEKYNTSENNMEKTYLETLVSELTNNEELAFVSNNTIVFIQESGNEFDYSFFINIDNIVTDESNPFFEEFDQGTYEDGLIDGGRLECTSPREAIEACLIEVDELPEIIVPSNEAEYICTECHDPDCSGCND